MMGCGANYADVITEEGIKQIVGNEVFDKFVEVANADDNYDFDDIAHAFEYDDCDDVSEEITDAYASLVKAFNDKTGLDLCIGYHCEDDGDKYDEVRGVYWSVGGMYDLTPEGKKLQEVLGEKNQVERQFFVTFG